MLWQDFRDWVVPSIAFITFAWTIYTNLRRNVVRPEDLARFATTDNLVGVNKVLQDQIDESDRKIVGGRHEVELLKKDVAQLPSYSDINRLREAISELTNNVGKLSSDVEGLDGSVARVDNSVNRVEQYLLELKIPRVTA